MISTSTVADTCGWPTKAATCWSYDGWQWRRHQPPQGAVRVSVSEGGQPVVLVEDARVYACTVCGGQARHHRRNRPLPRPPANRPPNAPSVSPGGGEPPFPIRYEGAIRAFVAEQRRP